MRYILSEYGILIVSIIGCVSVFTLSVLLHDDYKAFSVRFIGSITGNYAEYGTDLTIEGIEDGTYLNKVSEK